MNKKNVILVIVLAVILAAILVLGAIFYKELSKIVKGEETETTVESGTEDVAEKNTAQSFTVYDGDGNATELSEVLGKRPIVVNFWTSWCPPCRSELPDFDDAYDDWGDEVEFFMVNLTDGKRETLETAKKFVEECGYDFPVYYDTDGYAASVYSVYSIPVTVFIDKNGNEVHSRIGAMSGDDLEEWIEKIAD